MINNKKQYPLRVDEILLSKLKVISDKNHRSINSQIEYIIEICVSEYESKNGVIDISSEQSL